MVYKLLLLGWVAGVIIQKKGRIYSFQHHHVVFEPNMKFEFSLIEMLVKPLIANHAFIVLVHDLGPTNCFHFGLT